MANSPKLILEIKGKVIRKFAFADGQDLVKTLGKNPDNDIIVSHQHVSRKHCVIEYRGGKLFIKDIGSTNGTIVQGRKIEVGRSVPIAIGNEIYLGSPEVKVLAVSRSSTIGPGPDSSLPPRALNDYFQNKDTILIGRHPECDLQLKNLQVSKRHASVQDLGGGRYRVKDLNSLNGTYVNGRRITTQDVTSADRILIGRHLLQINAAGKNLSKEVAIRAEGVQKVYPSGHVGLHSTSFDIPTKSLVAIMGPSGCGKSTLLKVLNGDNPATKGSVKIAGLDLIENYEYLKTSIGYVPQDDIVHRELTVEQSLLFAGRLRLEGASDKELRAKIDQILQDLNIDFIRDHRVAKISGGQRKRVSIAVELLTDPLVLFLDEPTSPLDPQTIEEFLQILQNLAKKGTTVIMVTHKPEDLEYMDKAMFLAEGGHIVYYGQANAYQQYFNVDSAVRVYAEIVGSRSKRWIDKYNRNHPPQHGRIVTNPRVTTSTKANAWRQYFWLTSRYFTIKTNDRMNSFIMILQAPIIAGLIWLIFDNIVQAVPFLVTISAIWFGTNNAAREIVGELPIYKRERMYNVHLFPYVMSKLSVLGLFAVIQSILFTIILTLCFANNDFIDWQEPLATVGWMVFVTSAATLMGLLLSALVDTTERVMTIVPISLIPQIMLAGVLAKIQNPLVEFISYFTLSRWGNEGLSIIQQTTVAEVPDLSMNGPAGGEMPSDTAVVDSSSTYDAGSQDMSGAAPVDSVEMKLDTINAPESLMDFYHEKYETMFGSYSNTLELDAMAILALAVLFTSGILIALKRKDSIDIR